MHDPDAPQRHPGDHWSRAGAYATVLGALFVIFGFTSRTTATSIETQNVPLHNTDAETGSPGDCPDDGNAYWHLVLAPNNGVYRFVRVVFDLAGTTVTFDRDELVQNGGQQDNIFVAVPDGFTFDDLVRETSFAEVASGTKLVHPSDVKFVISHLCPGRTGTTTVPGSSSSSSTTSSTTSSSSTTSTSSTTSSSTSSTTSSTSSTLPSGDEPSVAVVCVESSADTSPTTYWFDVSNGGSSGITISWDSESAAIPAGESLVIASDSAELVLSVGGKVAATADGAAAERCRQDVEVTKVVDGPAADGATYTIQVSRLVGADYVPEAEPFELKGGGSITIPLDSTFDPEGITYRIEEIDAGAAHGSSVSPDTFVVNGHRGETIDVVVTNSYAAIRIDKTASADTVLSGGELTYTLEVTNVGALALSPVIVYDLLPPEVSLDDGGAAVAGGAGACSLVRATRPEMVLCKFDAPLQPAATAPIITLAVTVDPGLSEPDPVLNQAQAIGVYDDDEGHVPVEPPTELSCEPTTGLVCDLSAEIATGIEIVVVEAATTTSPSTTTAPSTTATPTTSVATSTTSAVTSTTVTGQIAVAGSGSSRMFIMIGAILILIGASLVLGAHADERVH